MLLLKRERGSLNELTPQSFRGTYRWKKISSYMRRKYPLCFNPFKMHSYKPADEVHHIIPISNLLTPKDRQYIFNTKNLVCLCYRCHRKVEAMNRKGIDTKVLFADRLGGDANLYKKRTSSKRKPESPSTCVEFRGAGELKPCKKLSNGYYCGAMNINRDIPCGNCLLNKEKYE